MGIDGAPVMLAFSPNGQLLALEGQEHVVRLFDLNPESQALRDSPPLDAVLNRALTVAPGKRGG